MVTLMGFIYRIDNQGHPWHRITLIMLYCPSIRGVYTLNISYNTIFQGHYLYVFNDLSSNSSEENNSALDPFTDTISYQLFWSMIQLISRNQRAVSPEAQPRVIQPSDCEI